VKKKILIVNHSSDLFGGANDDFTRILKYFRKHRDKYHIFGLFPEGPNAKHFSNLCDEWKTYSPAFFPVTTDNLRDYAGYVKFYFVQRREVRRLIRDGNFDLCILNVVVMLWFALWARKKINTLIFIRECILPDSLRKLYYRIISGFGDYFIAVSKLLEEDYVEITGKNNISTLYSAIENDNSHENYSDSWKKLLDSKSLNELNELKVPVFLCLGSLTDRKNQMLILKAFKILSSKKLKTMPHILFIGGNPDSPYGNSLKEYVDKNELSKFCHFIGEAKREYFYNFLPKAAGIIISSTSEGLPLVISEAFRFEVPLITTNVGGISDIVSDEYNGLIIENDADSLARSVIRLLDDENLVQTLIKSGRKTFDDKLNLESNLQEFGKIVDQVISYKKK